MTPTLKLNTRAQTPEQTPPGPHSSAPFPGPSRGSSTFPWLGRWWFWIARSGSGLVPLSCSSVHSLCTVRSWRRCWSPAGARRSSSFPWLLSAVLQLLADLLCRALLYRRARAPPDSTSRRGEDRSRGPFRQAHDPEHFSTQCRVYILHSGVFNKNVLKAKKTGGANHMFAKSKKAITVNKTGGELDYTKKEHYYYFYHHHLHYYCCCCIGGGVMIIMTITMMLNKVP